MNQQQQRIVKISLWLNTLEKIVQPICYVINLFICLWLVWIAFTRCDQIMFDYDLQRKCLNSLIKCPFNGQLIDTVVIYVAIELLYCSCKALNRLSGTWQFNRNLTEKLKLLRICTILGMHYLFIRLQYFTQLEFKEPQPTTITLCSDQFMSATL